MSHRLRSDGPDKIFHLTSRVNWRQWHLASDRAKLALTQLLREAAVAFGVRVLAGVFMSNHLHLVAQSPPTPLFRMLTGRRVPSRHFYPYPAGHQKSTVIGQFMKSMRQRMSVRWQKELGVNGKFWDSNYDARPVESFPSLVVRIAYDHRNPVKQGMVQRPEDYPWSSAREWVTGEPGRFPIALPDTDLFDAAPGILRAAVLAFQEHRALDDPHSELSQKLWLPDDLPEREFDALLANLGLPPIRGIDPAMG